MELYVIYGKNDHDLSLSLNDEDMIFLKQFPNIQIYHHPNLHAKFYANDSKSIVTSLNLHRYSIANNIEVGVLFEQRFSILGNNDNYNDNISTAYFMDLIKSLDPRFKKHITVKSSFFGLFKEHGESEIEVDQTDKFERFTPKAFQKNSHDSIKIKMGFCIRTGVPIPFDLKRPLCDKSYESWSNRSNRDYPEKYCHFSGEETNGETCYARPILRKNWRKAMGK